MRIPVTVKVQIVTTVRCRSRSGSLRQLRSQLALLRHRISGRLELKDVDPSRIELIVYTVRQPQSLAGQAGLGRQNNTGEGATRGGDIMEGLTRRRTRVTLFEGPSYAQI